MKRNPSFLIFWLCMLCTIIGCDKEEEPTQRSFEDVRSDFSQIDINSGTQDVNLLINNNYFYDFRVIPPDVVEPGVSYPLILALHGASNGSPTAHLNTDCYIEPGFEALDVFILSPNAGTAEWYELENQEKLFNLVSLSNEFWPIAQDKIVVTGYSNGGNASWFYAEYQSATFAAGIPLASSYDISVTDTTSRKIDIPLYVIHGENDELFPVAETQKWVQESVASGSDITFVVADTLTHFRPCDYVPYLQEAATWLEDDVFVN